MVNREAVGPYEQWRYSTALSGMQDYNQKIREIAEERGVILIDLENKVPKSLDYFIDDVHYSERAFGLIADYIAMEFNQWVLNKPGSEIE